MAKRRTWLDKLPIWFLRFLINTWPPFLGAAIHVTKISSDFRYIEVSMKLRWYNQNYVATHFGGSMFSMVDAFHMLMLLKNLGKNYIIWDKAAHIEFKKIAHGKIHAIFQVSEEELETIRHHADQNGKYVFDKSVNIIDEAGDTVATVIKTLYVRRKEPANIQAS